MLQGGKNWLYYKNKAYSGVSLLDAFILKGLDWHFKLGVSQKRK